MGTNQRKRSLLIKQIILLVVLVAGAVFGYVAFSRHIRDRDLLTVQFRSPDGRETPEYHLRIASTPGQRREGLMYVKPEELTDRRGMIFIFPQEREQRFWMKNTPSPLDMIFIGQNLKVAGVAARAKPFSLDNVTVGKPSMYVVEVLGGTAEQDGIAGGWSLVTSEPLTRVTE